MQNVNDDMFISVLS